MYMYGMDTYVATAGVCVFNSPVVATSRNLLGEEGACIVDVLHLFVYIAAAAKAAIGGCDVPHQPFFCCQLYM